MNEIDPITGLPTELSAWENISKEQQKIEVSIVKRKFGKKYTIIKGFDKSVDVEEIGKKLRKKFACGGSYENDMIELQGDHKGKAQKALVELGFAKESIELK